MTSMSSVAGNGSAASAGSSGTVIRGTCVASSAGVSTVNSSSRAGGSRSDSSLRSRRMPASCVRAQSSSSCCGSAPDWPAVSTNTRTSSSSGSSAGSSASRTSVARRTLPSGKRVVISRLISCSSRAASA